MRGVHINIVVAVLIFILLIAGGSYSYHKIEGWNTLDSVYFTVMTVTTVGYGDFVPQSNTGKIFTIFFSFLGIIFVFYFISIVGKSVFERRVSNKISRVKHSVKEDVRENVKSSKRKRSKKR